MSSEIYKPGTYPNLPPPPGTVGIFGWIKNNLFSSISNSTLTIISVVLIYYLIDGIIGWFFFDEIPIDTLFPGILLIIMSGLTILWREHKQNE